MKATDCDPKPLTFTLLRLLADGNFHSGEMLAQHLGISRASVNNALQEVSEYGLSLYSVRGRGYRVANPPQWLDPASIANHMGERAKHFHLQVLDCTPSSNTLLLQQAAHGAPSGTVMAVEWQSGGRGRFGRTWHSGLGNALTFSLLWRFECGLSALSGLSLGAGVALIRALRQVGVLDAKLKWPNDVLDAHGAKLAGILIEAQGDMLGPSAVVIGVGLNLSLPKQVLRHLDQSASSLADMTDKTPDRNLLLAILLRELDIMLREFSTHGFAALREEWETYHALQDQVVCLSLPDGNKVTGIARGVTNDGALKLAVTPPPEDTPVIQVFNVGDISLRQSDKHAAN